MAAARTISADPDVAGGSEAPGGRERDVSVGTGAAVGVDTGTGTGTPSGDDDRVLADRVWEAMRDLVHAHERQGEVVEAIGMSLAKVKALRRLARRPMTGKELAVEMLTDAPRASVLIDELVQRGLAVRTVHPEDRRVRIVEVTELGAAEAARAGRILARAPEVVRRLPAAELAELERLLRRFDGPSGTGTGGIGTGEIAESGEAHRR